MFWFSKYMGSHLMDEKKEVEGGGGADIETLKQQNADLMKRLEALEKPAPKKDDPSLEEKARLEREKKEKDSESSKKLEGALKFTLGSSDFMKNNAALLPKTIEGIFEQANKENYDSAIDKSTAIKVGIVSEFFAQQSNLDLLTESQKLMLEQFKNLSKTVKQERVDGVYDSIFEPTLEALRKIKRAESLQKGLKESNGDEDAYKNRLIKLSRQHHLREKQ